MTRVVFVSHSAELNGAERFLLDVLRELDRRRFAPALVIPRPGPLGDQAAAIGVAVRVLPLKWWLTERGRTWKQPLAWALNRRSVADLVRFVRDFGADLVLSNSAATFAGALAARAAGVPHVWFVHEILDGERPFLRYLFGRRRLAAFIRRHSARVVANSKTTARAFGGPGGRVAIVYNGLPAGRRRPADKDAWRRAMGFAPEDKLAGVIGKIYAGKGQREAVEVLGILRRRHPGLKLVFIGDTRDPRYRKSIEDTIAAHGLGDRVVFAGYQPDLDAALASLDLLLVPSSVESFGRAALEAMAAGVPVVAAPEGGLLELVRPGETGFLAASRRPVSLAAAAALVLEEPDRARAVAERAAAETASRFSLGSEVRVLEQILEDAVDR